MSAFLEFNGLEKRYGSVCALQGIDLQIESGSVLAVLGPNGAGKSTLLGCLLGLTRPTAGVIRWHGHPVTDMDRGRFGYLAERIALYPDRTVWDNGWFFAQLKNQPRAELERQLRRVELWSVRQRSVRQLSKGMLQRLGLAIALCGSPKLLVLDEPFNGLDPALLEQLQVLFSEEQERGATLLIATHTISAIEPLATHGAILLEGHLAAFGEVSQLRSQHREGLAGETPSRWSSWETPEDAPFLEKLYHHIARTHHKEQATGVELSGARK